MCAPTVASLDALQRPAGQLPAAYPAWSRPHAVRRCRKDASSPALLLYQARPPRATRLSTCRVSFPLPFPNSTSYPVTADVAVGAGSASQRQILRGRARDGGGLGGDVAARHPEYGGAVGQGGVRGDGDDHVREHIVAGTLAPREKLVVRDDLIAQRKGELGLRTLFAATTSSGLNTTSKLSVLDLAVLISAACDAAEIDTTPATASNTAATAPARGTFRMVPPPGCPGRPLRGPATQSGQPRPR
jgi:hypothetical protein